MAGESDPDALLLHLDGFDGPLDLLLGLARAQKVDLARISILALVDQFLAVVEGARRVRLELAADWLVMAAWLTWLKSRLLLPAGSEAAEEAEESAEILANRLRELQSIRQAAQWLSLRPQLGQDIFPRGAAEDFSAREQGRLVLDINALVRGYLAAIRRNAGQKVWKPRALTIWTVKEALQRLGALLGSMPDWASLEQFLPQSLTADPIAYRAALSSTLIAGLEMARGGAVRLRQEQPFGPIHLRRAEADTQPATDLPS